jgi:hypothetical protein
MRSLLLLGALSALFGLACSSTSSTSPADAASEGTSGDAGVPEVATGDASDAGADSGSVILDQDPISVMPESAREHEGSIAVSPDGHAAVCWLSWSAMTSTYTVGYRISTDDGATWAPATLVPLPPNINIQANATVAADDQGNLFMAWGAEYKVAGVRSHVGIYAAKAGPGAKQFGPAVAVTDPSVPAGVYDSPRIYATASGAVNIVYLHTSPDYYTSWLEDARSTDFVTWTRNAAAGPGTYGSFRNFQHICRSEGAGRIYLAYADTDLAFYSSGMGVGLRYSDDDGKTWSSPTTVHLASEDFLIPGYWTDCVTHGNDVWIMYALSPDAIIGNTP